MKKLVPQNVTNPTIIANFDFTVKSLSAIASVLSKKEEATWTVREELLDFKPRGKPQDGELIIIDGSEEFKGGTPWTFESIDDPDEGHNNLTAWQLFVRVKKKILRELSLSELGEMYLFADVHLVITSPDQVSQLVGILKRSEAGLGTEDEEDMDGPFERLRWSSNAQAILWTRPELLERHPSVIFLVS